MTTAAGIVDQPSKQSVDETVERIEAILGAKGLAEVEPLAVAATTESA